MTDEALIQQLSDGNDEALGPLFEGHRDRLRRILAMRMDGRLVGRLEVEDVLQDAYLASHQRLAHFRKGGAPSFFVWLRSITLQTLIDVTRHHLGVKKRDVRAEVSMQGEGDSPVTRQLLGKITSPTRALRRAEITERLEAVLSQMSDLDREILIMRHFEELTNNEAAEALGLSKAATTNRYVRALKRLGDVMGALPEFSEHLLT